MAPERPEVSLSDGQLTVTLRAFGVPAHRVSALMLRVVRLVLSRSFYEIDKPAGVPTYGFRPHEIVNALGLAENTRETVRDEVLKVLRDHDVLGYVVPAPRSPNTHYYAKESFKQRLRDNFQADEVGELPSTEETIGVEEPFQVELPFLDEPLTVAPGRHALLIVESLRDYVAQKLPDIEVIYAATDETERDTVREGRLRISFGNCECELPLYPDLIVYSPSTNTILILDAVVSAGPIDESRKEALVLALRACNCPEEEALKVMFVTSFPEWRTYRRFSMDIASGTFVWVAEDPDQEHLHYRGQVGTIPHSIFEISFD